VEVEVETGEKDTYLLESGVLLEEGTVVDRFNGRGVDRTIPYMAGEGYTKTPHSV
jgi:hypothetical protein